jgi:oxygen-dependent protoporphyrinogen oxidase
MPQYEVGHLETLGAAERGLGDLPIFLVGSSYRGNGIPDCVRQGREAAQRILQENP